jgi:lipoprotein LprG
VAVRRRLLCCLAAALTVAGCSDGGSTSVSPQTLVAQAKANLDSTSGLHFTLTSSGTPKAGKPVLIGGAGDLARPNGFRGTLRVQQSGVVVSLDVVSLNGRVLLRPPLTSKFAATDPHQYGFSDPGKLLDPTTGISRLLAELTSARSAGRDRLNGEKLDEVAVTLPGSAVADVLTSADRTQPVTGRLGIDPSSHELRRAVLTGPFLAKDVQTTFTIVLDHYGEHPTIRVPA